MIRSKVVGNVVGFTVLGVMAWGMAVHTLYTLAICTLIMGWVHRHKVVCAVRRYHKFNWYTDTCKCGHVHKWE